MPGAAGLESSESRFIATGLSWEDPEQEVEDHRAWQHIKAEWLAKCLPEDAQARPVYELAHSLGTQVLIGKRRVNIDSAVALGIIERPATQDPRALRELGPWERHKMILQHRRPVGCTDVLPVLPAPKSDAAALREAHEFIRRDCGAVSAQATWGERLAARYYSKLLKEYALCDLSRYRDCKVGLRWRTEQEVVIGKGQFTCGAIGCEVKMGLSSFEVPFQYRERGVDKQALVKVRVCPDCAVKLNWKKEREVQKLSKLVARSTSKHRKHRDKDRHRRRASDDRDASRGRSHSAGRDDLQNSRDHSPALDSAALPRRHDAACQVSPEHEAAGLSRHQSKNVAPESREDVHVHPGDSDSAGEAGELRALRDRVRREGRGNAVQLDALREQLRRHRSRSRGPSATPEVHGRHARAHSAHERLQVDVGTGMGRAEAHAPERPAGQAHERLVRAPASAGRDGVRVRADTTDRKASRDADGGFDGLIDDMLL